MFYLFTFCNVVSCGQAAVTSAYNYFLIVVHILKNQLYIIGLNKSIS